MTDTEKKKLLTKLFINGFYPYSKVVLGDLEKDYGIKLIEVSRAPFNGGIKYKPGYGEDYGGFRWIGKSEVLSWGSNTGWNINEDCTIALCRIEYDDYVNFEIHFIDKNEIFTEDEVYSKMRMNDYYSEIENWETENFVELVDNELERLKLNDPNNPINNFLKHFIEVNNLPINYIPGVPSNNCYNLLIIEFYDNDISNLITGLVHIERCNKVREVLILMKTWDEKCDLKNLKSWSIQYKRTNKRVYKFSVKINLNGFTSYREI